MGRFARMAGSRDSLRAGRAAQGKFLKGSARGSMASAVAESPMLIAQRRKLRSLFGAAAQLEEAPASKPNRTGLPDPLKAGIENLSGMSMDRVRVHYDSSKPAQLNALAYTQGSDIHVAPGQEKHLPHEAWHVVQQAQGRVRPTMQMAGGAAVIQRAVIAKDRLNVAGETHKKSNKERPGERQFALEEAGGGYWEEQSFEVEGNVHADSALSRWLQEAFFASMTLMKIDSVKVQKAAVEKVIRFIEGLKWDHGRLRKLSQEQKERVNSQVGSTRISVTVEQILASGLFERISSVLEPLQKKIEVEQANYDVTEEAGVLSGVYRALSQMINLNPDDLDNTNLVMSERSNLMKKAAQEHSDRLGIWKIGDTHVGDIKKDGESDALGFNLLSEREFQSLFAGYRRRKLREKIQEGKRGNPENIKGDNDPEREVPEKERRDKKRKFSSLTDIPPGLKEEDPSGNLEFNRRKKRKVDDKKGKKKKTGSLLGNFTQ